MDDIRKMLLGINYPTDATYDGSDRLAEVLAARAILTPELVRYQIESLDDEDLGRYKITDSETGELLGMTLDTPTSVDNAGVFNLSLGVGGFDKLQEELGSTKIAASVSEINENNVQLYRNNDLKLLHPYVRQQVESVLQGLTDADFSPRVLETYRQPALQAYYASSNGKEATSGTTFGYHCFVSPDGKLAAQAVDIIDRTIGFDTEHPRYEEFFSTLESLYDTWGFRRVTVDGVPDRPHGEIHQFLTKAEELSHKNLYSNSVEAKAVAEQYGLADNAVIESVGGDTRMFVTWGFIEDYLLQFCGQPLKSLVSEGSEVKSTQALNFDLLRSCDFDVCILPGQEIIKADQELDGHPVIKNSSLNYVSRELIVYPEGVDDRFEPFAVPDNVKRGYIRNILVNANFLESAYNSYSVERSGGNINLDGFVTSLLEGINKACGNLFKFTMVAREVDDKMAVVDANCVPSDTLGLLRQGADTVNYKIQNEFLVDLGVASDLSSELATYVVARQLASYENNYEQTRDSAVLFNYDTNQGVTVRDAFAQTAIQPTPKTEKDEEDIIDPRLEYLNAAYIYHSSGDNKIRAIEALSKLITENLVYSDRTDSIVPVPVNVAATVPGTSGFRFGNTFKLQSILEGGWIVPALADNFVFMVTSFDHSITPENWTTTLNAYPYPTKTRTVEYNYSGDFFEGYQNDEPLDDAKNPTGGSDPSVRSVLKEGVGSKFNSSRFGGGSFGGGGAGGTFD